MTPWTPVRAKKCFRNLFFSIKNNYWFLDFEWDILEWQHVCLRFLDLYISYHNHTDHFDVFPCSYDKDSESFSYYYNGQVTIVNDSNLLLDDNAFFDVNEVRKAVRVGKFSEGARSSASFSGQITDVNIWSYALTSHELEKWTRCHIENWARSPDIGQCN